MHKSKFSDAQIVAIVRESEAEGVTVEQVARKHGITDTTLFRRCRRFGGLQCCVGRECCSAAPAAPQCLLQWMIDVRHPVVQCPW